MDELAIKIENLKKKYYLGTIGASTVRGEVKTKLFGKKGHTAQDTVETGENISSDGRKSFYALDGINLDVKKGEALGIIGANGAGKSTLLKLITRITAPTEGDIWIDGRFSSMLEVGTGFHGELTGRENIYMNGAILGMSKKEVDSKIEDIIEFSECRKFIDTPVKRYSSGMYVKLAFAVASHLDSEILVMDEVLAVGDVQFQKKCLAKMSETINKNGRTILYVSHNMETIRNLCTRCVVLQSGRLIFDGDVAEAISVYSGEKMWKPSQGHIVANQGVRKADVEVFGLKMRLIEVDFKNKEWLYFTDTETVSAEVKIEALTDMENIYMAMQIFDEGGVNLGMQHVKLSDMEQGERASLLFETTFEHLPPGNYRLTFLIHSQKQNGEYGETLDKTEPIGFEVEKRDAGLEWNTAWFGKINFRNLSLKSQQRI